MPHDLAIEDLHIQEPEREDETLEWLLWYIDEMCYRNGTIEWEGDVSWALRPYRPYLVATLSDGQRWGIPDPTGRGLAIVGALQDGLRYLCDDSRPVAWDLWDDTRPVTIPRYELAIGHALDLLAAQRNVHRTADVDDETLRRFLEERANSRTEHEPAGLVWSYGAKHQIAVYGDLSSVRDLDGEPVKWTVTPNFSKPVTIPHISTGTSGSTYIPAIPTLPMLPTLPVIEGPKLFENDPVYVGKRNLARALTDAQCRAGGHPSGHPENERQVEHAMEWLDGQVRIWVQWLGGARTEGDR